MARENPLITLGIPRSVIMHEMAHGSGSSLLKTAELAYRSLARQYSADLPGGSADLMTDFNAAIEELRERGAVVAYAKELVSAQDVRDLYLRQQAQQLVKRDAETLPRVAAGLAFADQFAVLGIEGPTSYLLDFQGQRLVLDVLSPFEARARLTDIPPETPVGSNHTNEVGSLNGIWREAYVDGRYRKHWVPFDTFVTDETVRVVGFGPEDLRKSDGVIANPPVRVMLKAPVTQVRLSWLSPTDSWFFSQLHYDRTVRFPRLVLFRNGQFAITGPLMGKRPLAQPS